MKIWHGRKMPFSIKNKCALEKGKKEEGIRIQDFLLLVISAKGSIDFRLSSSLKFPTL